MMKQLAVFATIVVVILGCSSNTTSPPTTTTSYLPSTTGTYTIHDNVTLEDNGSGGVTESNPYTDSTVVTGIEPKSDTKGVSKNAVVHVVFVGPLPVDTMYLSQDGGKIYQLFDLGAAASDFADLDLGTTWILMADQNATSSWTAYSDSLSDVSFEYEGTTFNANIKIALVNKKIGSENMTVDGKTIGTIKYETAYTMTLYIQFPPFGVVPIPIALSANTWLGKDVGLVKVEQQPVNISVPALGVEVPIPGARSMLVRFLVK